MPSGLFLVCFHFLKKKILAAKSAAFANSNIFHSFSKLSHLFQLKVTSLKAFV